MWSRFICKMKIGDKVFIRTTNGVGIIAGIDKENIYVDCDDEERSRWINQRHLEPLTTTNFRIGDKVRIKTSGRIGIIRDMYNTVRVANVGYIDEQKCVWVAMRHLEQFPKPPKTFRMYRVTWGTIEEYEDIQAQTALHASQIWASGNICVEEICTKEATKLKEIDIQTFYSKSDGEFTITETPTSKSRYIE